MAKDRDSSDDYLDNIYDDEEQPKKKGSVIKAIGIGIGATLILELVIGLALEAETNLVHRYISYMLGIAILFVASIYAKSTLKMFFLGTPVIIVSSFVFPLILPSTFTALMSPFVTIIPSLIGVRDSLAVTGLLDATTGGYIELLIFYGWAIDLVIAMVVGTLASIGLTGVVKLFTGKPNILTIFTFIYSLFFILIGVILLPYLLVVSSGLTQFGLVMGAGTINLQAGIQELDTDIDNATAFFDEAQKWFAEGDDVLAGLEALQVFNLLGTAGPDYKVVVDNLLVLINSAVGMVQAISPLFLGVSQLGDGIGQSMAVLNSAGATLSLSQLDAADEAEFEAGIAKMKLAFIDLKQAIEFIDEVLIDISEFDEDALNLALANLGREGVVPPEASLIDGGVTLIGAALDVFDVLITPVNTSTVQPTLGDSVNVEAPLIHLIRGALELSIVGEKIGGTSSFEGTDVNFAQIITHLTLVDDSFAHPAFTDFNQTDVGTDETLIDLKNQIQGVFNFVDDAGDVAIAIGGFGLVAGPALTLMNTTLTPLGEVGFENLTQSQFDQMIDNFEKQPGGIIELATGMETEGITTDALVDQMATNAAKGDYGLMESAANDFVTQFEVFGLAKNGRNFKHIATGFNYLLRASKSLSTVSHEVDLMQGNFSEITALGSPLDNVILVEANLGNMGTALDIVKIELQLADDEIVLAATSFSMVEDMPQLQSTADSLLAIGDNIDEIQTQIGIIDTETTALEVEAGLLDFTNFTTHVNTITASLESIDVEFQEIQLEMSGVGIDAEA